MPARKQGTMPTAHHLVDVSFESICHIQVKLVGFDADAAMALRKQLALLTSNRKTPPLRVVHSASGQHSLGIRDRWLFDVAVTGPSLSSAIASYVHTAVVGEGESLLSASAVDRLLEVDFAGTGGGAAVSYTLYVLNVARPVNASNGERMRYLYRGDEEGTQCGFAVRAAKQRFAWLDLNAGPVSYGPSVAGEGFVDEASLPEVGRSVSTDAFAGQLAVAVQRATLHLFAPPLDRLPLVGLDAAIIRVQVLLVCDGDNVCSDAHLDSESEWWAPLKASLRDAGGDNVKLSVDSVQFADCPQCTAAYTHALRGFTGSVRDRSGTGLHASASESLDSAEMHAWLLHFNERFWQLQIGGLHSGEVVLPVFWYRLHPSGMREGHGAHTVHGFPLLLDREYQAVAFDDMVVVVETNLSAPIVTNFECSGTPQVIRPDDARRAALANVLRTGWGVSPPNVRWDANHRTPTTDYLFAVGLTPYGPFSSSKALSFSVRDAARRHVVLARISATADTVNTTLEHLRWYGRDVEDIMSAPNFAEFSSQLHIYHRAAERAAQLISLQDFEHSKVYLHEMTVSATLLSRIAYNAASDIRTNVECKGEYTWHAPPVHMILLFFGAIVLGLLLGWCASSRDGKRGKRLPNLNIAETIGASLNGRLSPRIMRLRTKSDDKKQ